MARKKQAQTAGIAAGARILVTGAAGGLGQQLIHRLLAEGYAVRAVDQLTQRTTDLEGAPGAAKRLEWVEFEYSAGRKLDEIVDGCAAIVHAAATVSLTESYDELRVVNLGFVEELYLAACRARVGHFVHLSCASIYRDDHGVHTESCPVEAVNGYERTKIEAEQVFSRSAATTGVAWTILRPALLYGAYCTSMAAGMVTLPAIMGGLIGYLPGLSG
ncbi:MAG: NAD(P)-dependent oxidoreductase, partial [Bradymonadaceae bacterium]|nr:NAD(P)-dependent oxidoreductase [Lujinxingiaceae bacterium]